MTTVPTMIIIPSQTITNSEEFECAGDLPRTQPGELDKLDAWIRSVLWENQVPEGDSVF